MNKPIRMFFMCIHNRCRSQIAEAFAKQLGGDNVIAVSAGIEPAKVHPMTVEVMKEVGIDISKNESKKIDMQTFTNSNIVIKLCEQVKEKCPIVPFFVKDIQLQISDPIPSGDIEQFRKVRDEIKDVIHALLKQYDCLK